jgi:hypothetical protein
MVFVSKPKATFSLNASRTMAGNLEASRPLSCGPEGRVDMLYHFIRLHVLLLCDMENSFILASLLCTWSYEEIYD